VYFRCLVRVIQVRSFADWTTWFMWFDLDVCAIQRTGLHDPIPMFMPFDSEVYTIQAYILRDSVPPVPDVSWLFPVSVGGSVPARARSLSFPGYHAALYQDPINPVRRVRLTAAHAASPASPWPQCRRLFGGESCFESRRESDVMG
jgi:hypothetical protein